MTIVDSRESNARPSGPPHSAHEAVLPGDRFGGYSVLSIVLHWLSILLVTVLIVALFAAQRELHLIALVVAAPIVLLNAFWRISRGFPRSPDLPAAVCFIARLATLTMLLGSALFIVSGMALPFVSDGTFTLFGYELLTAPWLVNADAAIGLDGLHGTTALLLVGAFIVHLLLAGVQALVGLKAINRRLITPVPSGR